MGLRHKVLRWIGDLYLWATRRLYNEFAPCYDMASWLVSAGRWAEWRRISLDYVTGERVLEVGFGTGDLLAELAQSGVHACGLEPSWAMQRVTLRKLRRRGVSASRVCGRAQTIPFTDGSFDTIISTFPSEYIADPSALREIQRVLRSPGGADDRGGQLVIVGLAVYRVSAQLPGRFWIPQPYPGVELFCDRLTDAGLSVRLVSRYRGSIRVPTIVAERR